MRKFIVSDIHGVGEFFYPMMNFLSNIYKEDDITLYINGDLFDRGEDSALILLDILNYSNIFHIIYLGGNHELMMHEYFKKSNHISDANDWFYNGGKVTLDGLSDLLNNDEEKIKDISDKISLLPIYHLFDSRLNDMQVVLVHARRPLLIKDICNKKIKDLNFFNNSCVWDRVDDYKYNPLSFSRSYFSIVGHTPVLSEIGFKFYSKNHIINIDGGCAAYALGHKNYNHFPLVEVFDEHIKIITFNDKNEIICGSYFNGVNFATLGQGELDVSRKYLSGDPYERKRKLIKEIKQM